MITTVAGLVQALQARDLLGTVANPTQPAAQTGAPTERPWYIGLLLGVAGWFSGIFLLIFVAILLRPQSGAAGIAIGLVLLAAAWGIFRADREGAFLSQLALAMSIAGQIALLFGLNEAMFKGSRLTGLSVCALVLQMALVLAMPNRLHRTMSTLFACCAWALCIRYGVWDMHGLSRVGGSQPAAAPGAAIAGWLVVWVPVGAALYWLISREPRWMAARRQSLLRPVATGLVVSLGVATLLSHPLESFTGTFGSAPRPGWLALWPLLSALASLAALAGAFAIGNRGLAGICIVAALAHASHFYYAMGATLLVKSALMLVLGALLLGAARLLRLRSRE